MKIHNSDVLSQGMREYGDGTQTVRQTTRGKLIRFVWFGLNIFIFQLEQYI